MATKFEGIKEKTTRTYEATLKDELGAVIPAASITTLLLTLYSLNSPTLAIVNARNQQSLLNANNGTVDANGLFKWEMQILDNQVLDSTLTTEIHRGLFEVTWAAGTKAHKHEVDFHVQNLNKVT